MKHKTRAHARLSPSTCERWWNCPGSVALIEKGNYVEAPSPYAEEGTLAHELAEWAVKGGALMGFPRKKEVTREMINAVDLYNKYIQDILEDNKLKPTAVAVEVKLNAGDDFFGTCDCLIYDDMTETLFIIDFKYGAGVAVSAHENKQLLCYAFLALATKYPEAQGVSLVIVQPRAVSDDGVIKRADYTRSQIQPFIDAMDEHIKATSDDSAPLSAGDWCRWCPAKSDCPRFQADLIEGLDAQVATIEQAVPADPSSLTPERMAKILNVKSMFIDWLDTVEAKALELAQTGVGIPGFKLVRGRAKRKWLNEEEVKIAFEKEYGSEIYETKLKSPAQLEKLVGKKEIEGLVIAESDKITLAPLSDKREAVQLEAGADFKTIEL